MCEREGERGSGFVGVGGFVGVREARRRGRETERFGRSICGFNSDLISSKCDEIILIIVFISSLLIVIIVTIAKNFLFMFDLNFRF